MTAAPVLDTHAWIWWLDGDPRLPRATADALDALPASARPILCDISLWEVAMLVERRRLALTIPFDAWLEAVKGGRVLHLLRDGTDTVLIKIK